VRTGQAHRTLQGHTGPITCLQFDEIHIVSGSLDKTVRVSMPLIIMGGLSLTGIRYWLDMGPSDRRDSRNYQL